MNAMFYRVGLYIGRFYYRLFPLQPRFMVVFGRPLKYDEIMNLRRSMKAAFKSSHFPLVVIEGPAVAFQLIKGVWMPLDAESYFIKPKPIIDPDSELPPLTFVQT